jgi:hypothetical protein
MTDRKKVNPAQIQKYLGGISFPISKNDLVQRAWERGADEYLVYALDRVDIEEFNSPKDVTEAIAGYE